MTFAFRTELKWNFSVEKFLYRRSLNSTNTEVFIYLNTFIGKTHVFLLIKILCKTQFINETKDRHRYSKRCIRNVLIIPKTIMV